MYRYIAIAWNDADRHQTDIASHLIGRIKSSPSNWVVAYEATGFVSFHITSRIAAGGAYPMVDGAGVVLGNLFHQSLTYREPPARPLLRKQETRAIVNSCGRYLVDRYWGSYVAFVRNPGMNETYVVRSPAGRMPCLFTTYECVDIYFARTEDCLQLGVSEFSTDWSYVLRHIACRGLQRLDGTGLKEVSQVSPGECITVPTGSTRRALYWDPIEISQTDIIEDQPTAVEAVRETTRACVAAWASCYENILLSLSGGLDSSIVLSCLTTASVKPKLTCINYVQPVIEGDERHFARLAARHAGVDLVEDPRDLSAHNLDVVGKIERTALPLLYTFQIFNGLHETRLAKQFGATAIFTGHLGDGVFHEPTAQHAASDYVRMHGIGTRVVSIALETARRARLPFWLVLFTAIRSRLNHPPFEYDSTLLDKMLGLTPEAADSIDRNTLVPPELRMNDGIPHGKLKHILYTYLTHVQYDPLGSSDRPETVPALISQPLLELCFRIPTYVLTAGGTGRAIARLAFANSLPPEIVNRSTKGAGTDQVRNLYANNLEFLRELLLDGILVEEGILDRTTLEESLAKPERVSNAVASVLPVYYSTEAWLRRWADSKEQKAVA